MFTILKEYFIEFVTILFVLCFDFFFFFGHVAYGILALWPGIESTAPALDNSVLTIEPPAKSPYTIVYSQNMSIIFA